MNSPVRVVVLTRAGCHLCDDAEAVVTTVVAALPAHAGVGWAAVDVDTDPELRAEYGDLVPVVLVDGVEVGHHRIGPAVLRDAIERARRRRTR